MGLPQPNPRPSPKPKLIYIYICVCVCVCVKKMLFGEKVYVVYMVNYKLTCVVLRIKKVQKTVKMKSRCQKRDIKFKNTSYINTYKKLTNLNQ